MKLRLLTVYCTVLILLACNKKDGPTTTAPRVSKLTSFSVTVLERTSISAVIQWDSSFNKANSAEVKYKVLLENTVTDTGLTRTTDTLLNLVQNKTYNGKVIAYIAGDSTFAEFSLSTYQGSIYAASKSDSYGDSARLGYFNGYPVPGLPVQPATWRYYAGSLFQSTLSNDTLFIVSNSRLKAVSATTGNLFWQASSNYLLYTMATYSKGKLYACTSDGALICFEGSNGQFLWSYRSPLSYINFVTTPVVGDSKVFVATRSQPGEIDCVDAQTGAKAWSVSSQSTSSRPLVMNGIVVFIIAGQGRVVAFNQNTGNIVWDRKDFGTSGINQFNPAYIDGKVIVYTNGKLSALDINTGNEIWNYDSGMDKTECVAGNGRVYICQDSIAGYDRNSYYRNLLCFDAKDGKLLWRQNSKASGHRYSRLVFGKDKVYAVEEYMFNPDYSRRIVAFNATNGNRDSFFDTHNPVSLNRYENIYDYCVKRDGIVYYSSGHGNYR